MPPKKPSLEELVTALSDKIDALSQQQSDRFDEMETLLKTCQDENNSLKETVSKLQDENTFLKDKVIKLEQHSRRNNVRVFGFDIDGDDRNADSLMDQLYNRAFLPILQGALSKGRLQEIPNRDRLIQSAHVLPGKEGKAKPVICRFTNNFYRTIVLQCKREFAPRATRTTSPSSSGPSRPAPLRYPMYEDVSPEVYRFLQQLAANSGIGAAWISGGAIRFKLKDSETVNRVGSIYDPIDQILSAGR